MDIAKKQCRAYDKEFRQLYRRLKKSKKTAQPATDIIQRLGELGTDFAANLLIEIVRGKYVSPETPDRINTTILPAYEAISKCHNIEAMCFLNTATILFENNYEKNPSPNTELVRNKVIKYKSNLRTHIEKNGYDKYIR